MKSNALVNKLLFKPNSRRVVISLLTLLALAMIQMGWIHPEAQKRIQEHARFNALQALLSTPVERGTIASNTELPNFTESLTLESFNTQNGVQEYVVVGTFSALYEWLQQLFDSQWFPQKADWQWRGDSIALGLSLHVGDHRVTTMPEIGMSPFPMAEMAEPVALPSCLGRWPEHLQLVATFDRKIVISDGTQRWQFQEGDVHPSSGLVLSHVANGEIALIAPENSKPQEPSVDGEFLAPYTGMDCLSATLRVSDAEAQQPRWLP